MRRAQFSLKTLLWLMAVVAVFCFGFIAGGGRERQQLDAERRLLVDKTLDILVRENRVAKRERELFPPRCGTP